MLATIKKHGVYAYGKLKGKARLYIPITAEQQAEHELTEGDNVTFHVFNEKSLYPKVIKNE